MATLPTGVITFLMTDVEASTRRWEREPDAMRLAMVRHDELFDASIERHAGVIVKPRGEGDSRFAVFPRATDAVVAAAECQQLFFNESWPTETSVRVRMALHTGEADLRDGDYYGSTVNRCARLRSLAYGGQSLISLATAQLVREAPPNGVTLRDLGQHRLKDLSWPEHVFQLVIPGVDDDFPPLQSLDRHPTNLPAQPTPFIGREQEIETVREWLLDPGVRMVTLTGPGGAGKTRLSLQVAASLVEDFPDGVFMVPLEDVRDPELILQSVLQAVGMRETGGATVAEDLNEFLREKQILLLFDNFERLVGGASQLADLLAANPTLKILVTSRISLRIRGEQELAVPPLGLPDPGKAPPLDQLMEYEAIRLFIQRAQDVKPDFTLTKENAGAVLAISRRLDGLPLAIELAAARVRLFPPQALLKRLDHRLALLTGGARDLPARQQRLRDTIAWSYDLLTEPERTLFRRLAVFAGGFTLDAAVAVTGALEASEDGESGGDPWLMSIEVYDGIEALVSKSLLRQEQAIADDGEDPRFRMLETIREFGFEQLELAGELDRVRRAHAAFFLELASMAEPELDGPDQGAWLNRLETEHGNLRAALNCALDAGDADLGLRLTGTLWPFWEVHGHFSEGRDWAERMLTLDGEPYWRAKTLTGAGTMAWYQGDYEAATTFHTDAFEHYRVLDDKKGIAFALSNLGLQNVGLNNFQRATELFEEAMANYQECGDESGIADIFTNLAVVEFYKNDLSQAAELFEKSLEIRRKLGDKQRIADALHNIGEIFQFKKEHRTAADYYRESLRLRRELGASSGTALSLAALAGVATVRGDLEYGARLMGAADALFETSGGYMDPSERARYEEIGQTLRAELGDTAYQALREEGYGFPIERAIDFALVETGPTEEFGGGGSSSNLEFSTRTEQAPSF